MSYAVKIAGTAVNAPSYAAAVRMAQSGLSNLSERIKTNRNLFRSPKTRARIAAAVESVTFPKKAGNFEFNIGGLVPVRIVKE